MASKNVKKRNWAFVLYPESAPQNWREQLQLTGLQCAISPLHDRDYNADNEPKKPHYHVILAYSGPTSYDVVRRLTNGQLGQTIPQPLEQIRGYYRYLTHEDNPEKAQYNKAEIETINGFDIRDYVELTKTEVDKIKFEISAYIRDNQITEYSDLVWISMCDDAPADWFGIVSGHTLYFTALVRSVREGGARRERDKQ